MENQLEQDLRKVFEAGKNCVTEHPDDDSYDSVHFDRALSGLSESMKRMLFESKKPTDVKEAEKYIQQCNSDMGFMGSPQYTQAKELVEKYYDKNKK